MLACLQSQYLGSGSAEQGWSGQLGGHRLAQERGGTPGQGKGRRGWRLVGQQLDAGEEAGGEGGSPLQRSSLGATFWGDCLGA